MGTILTYAGTLILVAAVGMTVGYLVGSRRRTRSSKVRTDDSALKFLFSVADALDKHFGTTPTDKLIDSDFSRTLGALERRYAAIKKAAETPKPVSGSNPTIDPRPDADSEIPDEPQVNEMQLDDKAWERYQAAYPEKSAGIFVEAPKPAPESVPETAVRLYNAGVADIRARDLFWNEFQTTQIDNTSAVEQTVGHVSLPVFRPVQKGTFYAIAEPSTGNFLVVPAFDTTIKVANYETTFKFVFDCQGFDESQVFSMFSVASLAVFRSTGGGDWSVVSKGVLKLTQ